MNSPVAFRWTYRLQLIVTAREFCIYLWLIIGNCEFRRSTTLFIWLTLWLWVWILSIPRWTKQSSIVKTGPTTAKKEETSIKGQYLLSHQSSIYRKKTEYSLIGRIVGAARGTFFVDGQRIQTFLLFRYIYIYIRVYIYKPVDHTHTHTHIQTHSHPCSGLSPVRGRTTCPVLEFHYYFVLM